MNKYSTLVGLLVAGNTKCLQRTSSAHCPLLDRTLKVFFKYKQTVANKLANCKLVKNSIIFLYGENPLFFALQAESETTKSLVSKVWPRDIVYQISCWTWLLPAKLINWNIQQTNCNLELIWEQSNNMNVLLTKLIIN